MVDSSGSGSKGTGSTSIDYNKFKEAWGDNHKDYFDLLDKDKDGNVTEAEIKEKNPNISGSTAEEMLSNLPVGVNFQQFQEALIHDPKDKTSAGLASQSFFNLLDTDHSGIVTKKEIEDYAKDNGVTPTGSSAEEMLQSLPSGKQWIDTAQRTGKSDPAEPLVEPLKKDSNADNAFSAYLNLPEDDRADAITSLMKREDISKDQKMAFLNKLIEHATKEGGTDSDKNLARMAAANLIVNLPSVEEQKAETIAITNNLANKGLLTPRKDGTDPFLSSLENARNKNGDGFSAAGQPDSIIDTYSSAKTNAATEKARIDDVDGLTDKIMNGFSTKELPKGFDKLSPEDKKRFIEYSNDPNVLNHIKERLKNSGKSDEQINAFIGEGGYVQSYNYSNDPANAQDPEKIKNGFPKQINGVGDFINAAHQFYNKLPADSALKKQIEPLINDDTLAQMFKDHDLQGKDLGWAIQSIMQEANKKSGYNENAFGAATTKEVLTALNGWDATQSQSGGNIINQQAGNDLLVDGGELADLINRDWSQMA